MRAVDIIVKKRDGYELSEEELKFIINGYVDGSIESYQISALLMAIFYKGMTFDEVTNLTKIMIATGDTLDFKEINGYKADKHSTGGVGDKTTLVVGPIVAAVGIKFPKMSGRGLGHTGGTIDKLESIPGFNTALESERFIKQVNEIGLAINGQTAALVPADKLLYALRDVTGTVDSIPLIASSIMSKKLALGSDSISLDVKVGSGAFMKTKEDAIKLSEVMVNIGKNLGRNTTAILTDMDEPLGLAIGNSLEVIEAIDTLNGNGNPDFERLCLTFAAHIILDAKLESDFDKAYALAKKQITNHKALEKLALMVKAQDGDESYIYNKDKFKLAKKLEIKSLKSGYISKMNALKLGIASMKLGAGRKALGDKIDHSVGIVLAKKVGDYVNEGELLATIYTNNIDNDEIIADVLSSYEFDDSKVEKQLIIATIK